MLIVSVVRAELEQGMVKSGQFTQQESKLVFEIADIDGNGNQLLSIVKEISKYHHVFSF